MSKIQVNRSERIFVVFLFILLAFFIFIVVVYVKLVMPRKMPNLNAQKLDVAMRGSILSKDGYSIARSKKLYKLGFNPNSIDPDKKELFITLLEIYSNIPRSNIESALKQKKYKILSYSISPNTAANLKVLNTKLLNYQVFREYEDEHGRLIQKMGLNIEVSGVSREYPYGKLLTPIIGYTQKELKEFDITMPKGVNGLEKSQDSTLRPTQNGILKGKRDIGFNVIYSKAHESSVRIDGFDVQLGIPLKLQQKIEEILDSSVSEFESSEIIAGILNPKNGQILALATSNRFYPKSIKKDDYSNLINRAIESFEPGSTIKPLVYSLLLDKDLINPMAKIDLNNGYYKIGRYTIRDDVLMPSDPTIEDVLLKSSNVGMIKLVSLLTSQELYDGLRSFGLAELSGIDLPYEKDGVLPSVRELGQEAAKASVSYGYKLRVTFMQFLRAYGVFVNGGYLVTPHIVQNFISQDKQIFIPQLPKPRKVIKSQTAKKMEDVLIKVVESGTGKAARVQGLVVGGKTGTARIAATSGGYGETYNGSFFGFIKDKENTYVVGVVALGSHGEKYHGSQTAAPVFNKIAQILIKDGYLKPTN